MLRFGVKREPLGRRKRLLVEIEYALDESDIVALAKYKLRHTPTLRRRMLILRLGYLIGFTAMSLGIWLLYRDTIILVTLLGLTIISLSFPLYHDWRLRSNVYQTYRDAKNRAALDVRTLRATSEGLEEKSSFGETKVRWNTIDRITITPSYTFMSVIVQGYSVVIPKNQVRSGNYDEFVNACLNYQQSFTEHALGPDARG